MQTGRALAGTRRANEGDDLFRDLDAGSVEHRAAEAVSQHHGQPVQQVVGRPRLFA
jgi:hypothetical protein